MTDDGEAAAGEAADGEVAAAPRSRRTRKVVLVIASLGFVYYLISFIQVHSTGAGDEARPVDAIVVMGAAQYDGRPSAQLAARLDHALELWNDGLAPLVAVTGGNQPGDRFTEAEASATYLIDRGVPAAAILREDDGGDSYESLRAVAELLRARGLHSVLLVSDPFHSLRIKLIAEEVGLTAYVSPTRTSPVDGGGAVWRELKEAAGVSIGRVISFRRLAGLVD